MVSVCMCSSDEGLFQTFVILDIPVSTIRYPDFQVVLHVDRTRGTLVMKPDSGQACIHNDDHASAALGSISPSSSSEGTAMRQTTPGLCVPGAACGLWSLQVQ